MSSTPIIDEVIDYLINKGYKVNVSRNIFKNDNKHQYNNSNKNKLRKSKRNLLRGVRNESLSNNGI